MGSPGHGGPDIRQGSFPTPGARGPGDLQQTFASSQAAAHVEPDEEDTSIMACVAPSIIPGLLVSSACSEPRGIEVWAAASQKSRVKTSEEVWTIASRWKIAGASV